MMLRKPMFYGNQVENEMIEIFSKEEIRDYKNTK